MAYLCSRSSPRRQKEDCAGEDSTCFECGGCEEEEGEGVGPEEGCGDAYPSVVAGWSFDFAGVVFVAGALYFVVEDVEGEYEGGGGEGEDGDRHLNLPVGGRLLLF